MQKRLRKRATGTAFTIFSHKWLINTSLFCDAGSRLLSSLVLDLPQSAHGVITRQNVGFCERKKRKPCAKAAFQARDLMRWCPCSFLVETDMTRDRTLHARRTSVDQHCDSPTAALSVARRRYLMLIYAQSINFTRHSSQSSTSLVLSWNQLPGDPFASLDTSDSNAHECDTLSCSHAYVSTVN